MLPLSGLLRPTILIVAGLVFIAAPMAALKLGLFPILDGLGALPAPPSVAHPLAMLAAMTLGYFAFVLLIDRRGPAELAPKPVQAFVGIGSAVALIGTAMLALYLAGFYRLLAIVGGSAIWGIVPTILAAATLEELAFRGVIFSTLERYAGTRNALLAQSLLFGVLHMFNTGFTEPIDFLAVVLIGAMWTLLYVVWRNIWSIALHHAAWNLTITVSGLPLSGVEDFRAAAPFRSDFVGPRLLTGGDAGPESSLVTLAVVCVAIVVIWRLAQRRAALRGGSTTSTQTGPS